MVSFFGEFTGRLSFYGQGAGKYPTGASVAADIIELTKTKEFGASCHGKGKVDNSAELHRYYVRTSKKLSTVDAVAETYEANGEDFCAVTRELSVAEMHELAKAVRAEDEYAFFAGIHTEV